MKLYITAASRHSATDILQFIGRDLWVKVQYWEGDHHHYEWYIRPLNVSNNKLTFNLCGTAVDWDQYSWSNSTVASVLKDKAVAALDRIQILQPLEVLTTKEILAKLYTEDFNSEDDFHIRPGRGVETHDLTTGELSYVEEEE